jgi:hypothetical protein
MDSHHFGNLVPPPHQKNSGSGSASGSASNENQNLYPHPALHQSDKLDTKPDPDPHQFADDKPKCMDNEPI